MLCSPNPSPYDLYFSVGRIPVRVHVSFWIFTAILGWPWVNLGLGYLALWVLCVFFSILLHELGHVWAGQLFGSDGEIVLYSFGGLAIGASELNTRWQRVVVYLAGPGIQFLLLGALWAASEFGVVKRLHELSGRNEYVVGALMMLWIINLYWPLMNLLPIWPLDGGQVSREVCEATSRRNGTATSLTISVICAAVIAINGLAAMNGQPIIPYLPVGGMFTVIMFGLLAFESWQLLQRLRRPYDDY